MGYGAQENSCCNIKSLWGASLLVGDPVLPCLNVHFYTHWECHTCPFGGLQLTLGELLMLT